MPREAPAVRPPRIETPGAGVAVAAVRSRSTTTPTPLNERTLTQYCSLGRRRAVASRAYTSDDGCASPSPTPPAPKVSSTLWPGGTVSSNGGTPRAWREASSSTVRSTLASAALGLYSTNELAAPASAPATPRGNSHCCSARRAPAPSDTPASPNPPLKLCSLDASTLPVRATTEKDICARRVTSLPRSSTTRAFAGTTTPL